MARQEHRVRFGIVTAWPDEDWHSRRLLEACAHRGEASSVDPSALGAFVTDAAVEIHLGGRAAATFDALLLARGLGRVGDPGVQFELYRALEGTGNLVANRIDALLAAQDKLRTSWLLRLAGVPTPPAAVAQSPREAAGALAALGEVVVKPITGSLGDGLVRASPGPAGRRAVLDFLGRDGAVYMQRYVPHPGRDARLFVVGPRVVGAMERVAAPGEWRTNVGLGASVRQLDPPAPFVRAAIEAARALGLDWAGVDLLSGPDGPTVLEVNGTPSWEGILEATGRDMAEPIADHVWRRARQRARRSTSTKRSEANHG